MAQLALRLAKKRGKISQDEIDCLEENLIRLPNIIDKIVNTQEQKVKTIAREIQGF